MAALMRRSIFQIYLKKRSFLFSGCRLYTTEPPDWMGGRNILDRPSKYDFPEHTETFESRMNKMEEENNGSNVQPVDIGAEYSPPKKDKKELMSISVANRRNRELEQNARLRKLNIPLDTVKSETNTYFLPMQTKVLAEHYGVYRDLFGDAYFMPVVNLRVLFDYDDNYVTPVYRGNCILPNECKSEPTVEYESEDDKLWTLLQTSPDSHLTDSDSEYIHWLVGNIPGNYIKDGEILVDYLQPIPVRGTGFHRHVFVLFEQNKKLDFSKWRCQQPCRNLEDRTFKTAAFFDEYREFLTPKGLSFFQCEWDESVRHVFHNLLDMEEPSYEYAFPPPYHPPPKKYPHREPFDRYFDRYRDRKDLAEEVLRLRLQETCPFEGRPPPEKYPHLIHRKTYKPSWLKNREELMLRRVEQFKDLN